MNTSKRLQPLVEIAQKDMDDAARKVAACRQKVNERKLQLDELAGYRQDYTNGLQHKSQAGLNATQMNDYSVFLGRLNHAIEEQQVILESAYSELSTSKRVWLEKQQRAKALENVVSRHELGEQQEQSRREQGENDEHALRVMRAI